MALVNPDFAVDFSSFFASNEVWVVPPGGVPGAGTQPKFFDHMRLQTVGKICCQGAYTLAMANARTGLNVQ